MGMNAQLHLVLDSSTLESLRKQAEKQGTTISELCRQKLCENSQLDKIERLIKKVLESKL